MPVQRLVEFRNNRQTANSFGAAWNNEIQQRYQIKIICALSVPNLKTIVPQMLLQATFCSPTQ